MEITIRNPKGAEAPAAYSHAIEAKGEGRTLYIAGQVGLRPDGTPGEGLEEQANLLFTQLETILADAGMTFANVVKTTVFMTNPEDYPAFGKLRSAYLKDVKPASTLVYVSGLVRPELVLEVEAIAVGPAE
ncbi:MAG: RidA family protein [Pseudomonadota bacterium]|nr:RidA family protein [Pseudomonadota bacterium]